MKDLLIVVDMEEGFRSPASEAIVPAIKELIWGFRGEIVFACFRNERGSMFDNALKWKKFQNKREQDIMHELRGSQRKVLHKNYTIIDNKFASYIKKSRFRNVYIAGIYTDVCIIKAAMDAFDNNIRAKVVRDACGSLHGGPNHKFAIDSLKHIIGKNNVVATKDVI